MNLLTSCLFYFSNKKGVDFIEKFRWCNSYWVDVGKKKTKSQLTRAQNEYCSDFGILISNRTNSIEFGNDIIYIPLMIFH